MTDIEMIKNSIRKMIYETDKLKCITLEEYDLNHVYVIRNADMYNTTPLQLYIGNIIKQSNDVYAYIETTTYSNGEYYTLCLSRKTEKIARIAYKAKIDSTMSQILCDLKDGLLPFTSVTLY